MLDALQYRLLKAISPRAPGHMSGATYAQRSKLQVLLGDLVADVSGRTVLDFGCGEGSECLELARLGASRVIGLDIRDDVLARAREAAAVAGLDDRVEFTTSCSEPVDVIVSLDAFEHFASPDRVLDEMSRRIKPDGAVIASFGPTWYHPYGGHLFSVFPWAHLVFSESALIRWRSDFKSDGATRFGEVAGGLNQMTIGRFEHLVRESPFAFDVFEAVPIRRLRIVHNRLTREFTTAIVRCRLVLE